LALSPIGLLLAAVLSVTYVITDVSRKKVVDRHELVALILTQKDRRMQRLLEFLDCLDEQKIHFTLARYRSEAIMVEIAVPGERWEVEFFGDGSVEVEVFRSTDTGVLGGQEAEEALDRLFEQYGEKDQNR
jgi:hypothetical protein